MKQTEINRLEMFQAVNTYLNTHSTIWNTIVVAGRYKSQLSAAITSLQAAADKQQQAQVFVGSSLLALKRSLADKMDILDDTLEGYAEDTDNAALLAQAQNSRTDYLRLPHEDFATKVREVIRLLEANEEALADYGITGAQLEEVKTSLGQFQEQRGKPRQYQVSSSAATGEIATLIRAGSTACEKLDRVLKRFRSANASFYRGYTSARKIVGD